MLFRQTDAKSMAEGLHYLTLLSNCQVESISNFTLNPDLPKDRNYDHG